MLKVEEGGLQMDDKDDNNGVNHEEPEKSEKKPNEEEPIIHANEDPQEKLNKKLQETRVRLKEQYPDTFEKFENWYNLTWDKNFPSKSIDDLNKILKVITENEHYSFMYTYKGDEIYYNFNKIYSDYYNQISKDNDLFINDLIYLFRISYASLSIPDETTKYFLKTNTSFKYSDPYPFLENLCKLYPYLDNGNSNINAIIYFTIDGDKYRKEHLIGYQLKEVINRQDKLDKELEELRDGQSKLSEDIKNHTKEIISIIAIILCFAPLIAVNVTGVQKFSSPDLLVVNGCLIIGITTIFSVVNVAFFELKRRHGLLIIPLLLGIALICFGLQSPKQVSTTPATTPITTTVPAPNQAKN